MTPVKRTFSQILFEDKSMPFQVCDDDLNDAVIVLEMSRRKNKKYRAEEVIFKARVDPERLPSGITGVPLGTIIGAVRELFLTIIERTTETLEPTGLIRFYIQDDHLDHPISTTIMHVSDLTIEKILTEILKVLQSKKSIQLDSGFMIEVITIRRSVGAERSKVANISLDRLRKQTYKGKERSLRINLRHHNNHYDVIKSIKGFFGSSYYCENCEKPYSHCEAHRCPKACYICLRVSSPPGQPQTCKGCDPMYQKVIRHTKPSREKKKNPFVTKYTKSTISHLPVIAGLNNTLICFQKLNRKAVGDLGNIKNIYLPSEEVAAIQWQSSQDFVKQDTSTNIFIAAFTTAWSRLKLYQEMDKLGDNVLYHDTDSIIYASDGMNDAPLGNFPGEFTEELEGDEITTFVSGGPKNYGYKTKNGETYCKIRGFTLNYRNIKLMNFYSVRDLVLSLDDTVITLCNPAKICRDP
ncbi:DNA-directed DNA polymerase [Caerostris darwini]|uniref:DNA-directed DNA polymerase n=1 Tax=Caerostris darwini TaxID=1538125 RepID=A0AAV4UTH6_9ARAC|nr:DNA-directed DNA polymerase [Caerostris darwini]